MLVTAAHPSLPSKDCHTLHPRLFPHAIHPLRIDLPHESSPPTSPIFYAVGFGFICKLKHQHAITTQHSAGSSICEHSPRSCFRSTSAGISSQHIGLGKTALHPLPFLVAQVCMATHGLDHYPLGSCSEELSRRGRSKHVIHV